MIFNEKDFEVKKSTIKKAGNGLYALKDIKKGDTIGDYKGVVLNEKQFNNQKEMSMYVLFVTKNHYIDAKDPKKSNYTRYINHSSKPNCVFVTSNRWKTAKVKAIKNIKTGEELFLDYGPDYWIHSEPK